MFMFLLFSLIICVAGKSITIVKTNSSKPIPTLPFPNSFGHMKIRGNATDHTFVLFEGEYLNEGVGHHLHTKDDELFYIIDGRVQFVVNDTQFCASTGDYVYVPHHVSQGFKVHSPTETSKSVRIQIMLFPSGLEYFLEEVAILFKEDRDNQTAIDILSQKYGIVQLGPVDWKDLGCF